MNGWQQKELDNLNCIAKYIMKDFTDNVLLAYVYASLQMWATMSCITAYYHCHCILVDAWGNENTKILNSRTYLKFSNLRQHSIINQMTRSVCHAYDNSCVIDNFLKTKLRMSLFQPA